MRGSSLPPFLLARTPIVPLAVVVTLLRARFPRGIQHSAFAIGGDV
jgi:hypothetical protein